MVSQFRSIFMLKIQTFLILKGLSAKYDAVMTTEAHVGHLSKPWLFHNGNCTSEWTGGCTYCTVRTVHLDRRHFWGPVRLQNVKNQSNSRRNSTGNDISCLRVQSVFFRSQVKTQQHNKKLLSFALHLWYLWLHTLVISVTAHICDICDCTH
jgi:hypothetical protein